MRSDYMQELENLVMVIYEDDSFERDAQRRRGEIRSVVEAVMDFVDEVQQPVKGPESEREEGK